MTTKKGFENYPSQVDFNNSYQAFLGKENLILYLDHLKTFNDLTLQASIVAVNSRPDYSLAGFILSKRNIGLVPRGLDLNYDIGIVMANSLMLSSLPENVDPPCVNIFDDKFCWFLASKFLRSKDDDLNNNPYYFDDVFDVLTKESRVISKIDKDIARRAYLDYFTLLSFLMVEL